MNSTSAQTSKNNSMSLTSSICWTRTSLLFNGERSKIISYCWLSRRFLVIVTMFVLVQCGNYVRVYLILIRLTENVLLLEGFGAFAQRVDTTVLFFLQLWLNYLQRWGLKVVTYCMSFSKILNSSGKPSNRGSLNISNSACSISLL